MILTLPVPIVEVIQKLRTILRIAITTLTLRGFHPSLVEQEDAMSVKNVGSPSPSQVHLAQRTSTSHTQYSMRLP